MAKSHGDVVLECDAAFLQGLCTGNAETIRHLVHRDLVFTNESGRTYYQADNIPYSSKYSYRTIEVLKRDVKVSLSLGIIDSSERRLVESHGEIYQRLLRYNRIWQFDGRCWQLISVTATSIT